MSRTTMPTISGITFGSDVRVNFVAIEEMSPIVANPNVKTIAEREMGLMRD